MLAQKSMKIYFNISKITKKQKKCLNNNKIIIIPKVQKILPLMKKKMIFLALAKPPLCA